MFIRFNIIDPFFPLNTLRYIPKDMISKGILTVINNSSLRTRNFRFYMDREDKLYIHRYGDRHGMELMIEEPLIFPV